MDSIEFIESIVNSPSYINKLLSHESHLNAAVGSIKELSKYIDEYTNINKSLSNVLANISKLLSSFPKDFFLNKKSTDEICIENAFYCCSELINNYNKSHQRMNNILNEQITKPFNNYCESVESLKSKKKKNEAQKTKVEFLQEKLLNMKIKPANEYVTERSFYHELEIMENKNCEYLMDVLELEEKLKFQICENILIMTLTFNNLYLDAASSAQSFKTNNKQIHFSIQNHQKTWENVKEMAVVYKNSLVTCDDNAQSIPIVDEILQNYFFLIEKKSLVIKTTKIYLRYDIKRQLLGLQKFNKSMQTYNIKSATFFDDKWGRRYIINLEMEDNSIQQSKNMVNASGTIIVIQALNERIFNFWKKVLNKNFDINSVVVSKFTKKHLDDNGLHIIKCLVNEIDNREFCLNNLYKEDKNDLVYELCQYLGNRNFAISSDTFSKYNLKVLTTTFKLYIGSFNEPLFTFENYENIIKAAKHSNKEQQIDLILVCLDSMNQIHYQSVKCVFHHFYRIYIKSKKNKGFLNDISMIFGSILINSKIQSLTTLINAKFSNSVLCIIIENYGYIFESELKNSDTNSLEKIDNLKNSNLDLSTSSSFFKFSESRNNSINNEINTPKSVRPSPLPPTSNSFNKQDSFDQDQALKSPKPRQVPPIPQRVQKQQTLDVVEPKTPTLEINRKFSVDCKKNKKQKKKSKEENSYLKTVYITSRAVTLFQCKAERDEELSFDADILLTKIKPSVELGWYVATDSDNNTGLVPENYIKFI